jgi:hypothetical protein
MSWLERLGLVLTRLGLSRDDAKWFWLQLVGVATLVTTGALDLTNLGNYVGMHLSAVWLHRVFALCSLIVWLAARFSTSPLYNQTDTAAIVRADQHV